MMHHHFVRGPSRLLWFIIGAGSATWWIKSRELHGSSSGPCWRAPIRERTQNPDWTFGDKRWEEDREKMKEVMANASEATLDSIVIAAQNLKKRLAEVRPERKHQPETPEQRPESKDLPTSS
ncbi:hypothetical protein BDN72DRAFT_427248 [Pluteus cervinus]|uniref:Uncharacterized protein n=1 Tax=Pluteus cervinus TaxID=181527 RepID=A0ACD3B0V9_9AGAR|nr:hypothetical protein BDN72DRAFT_427248 [Pluteus cervinus]